MVLYIYIYGCVKHALLCCMVLNIYMAVLNMLGCAVLCCMVLYIYIYIYMAVLNMLYGVIDVAPAAQHVEQSANNTDIMGAVNREPTY